jgi:hypothetical protein
MTLKSTLTENSFCLNFARGKPHRHRRNNKPKRQGPARVQPHCLKPPDCVRGHEGRKRVLLIAASILAARKLAQYDDGTRVPATMSAKAELRSHRTSSQQACRSIPTSLSLDTFDLARGVLPQMRFSLRPLLFAFVLPPTVVGLWGSIYCTRQCRLLVTFGFPVFRHKRRGKFRGRH